MCVTWAWKAAAYIMDTGLTLEEFTQEWQSVLLRYEQAMAAPNVTAQRETGFELVK